MVDFSDLATWLTAGGSVALVITLVVLIYQMRQNTRAVEQELAMALMGDLTSPSFADRRHHLHHTVARFRGKAPTDAWEGFDDTKDDFEVRSFAYKYELIGLLVKRKTLEYAFVRDVLQWSVVADWRDFAPLDAHLKARFGAQISEWHHFAELAARIRNDLKARERSPAGAA